MRNFKILIQYEGTKYQGWQRQESTGNTIQGKFEAILSKMTDSKVQIDGSGRTDAGVHAYGQVANFKIDTKMSADEMDKAAQKSTRTYTIASRCGVFAKSDIQPLINQGAQAGDSAAFRL